MEHLPQVFWPLALAVIATAATATAVVQLLKDLLPIRRQFQRSFLASWFSQRLAGKSKTVTHEQLIDAETDLIHLATGGDQSAFYNLEAAQLCGQMNSAAQIAMAYPNLHPTLLRFLAPEADEGDLDKIVAGEKADSDVNALLDARNRVTHHLQRSIDALQIAMGFRWKFYLQSVSYVVCFVLAFFCLSAVKQGGYTVAETIAVAICAGFLSPVISDFAGAVNRWQKG
ncbi:MAG: hypothetical protein DME97_05050 [Verrucomicrobia bacterium]|nr:MAG: hypothetical protein DME97_05050 [Verrucomicrobiota bacterium]